MLVIAPQLVGNVARAPAEEKFRKIRLTNPAFQQRVGSLPVSSRQLAQRGAHTGLPCSNLKIVMCSLLCKWLMLAAHACCCSLAAP